MPDPSSREHQKEDWKAHKFFCGEKGAAAPDPTVTAGAGSGMAGMFAMRDALANGGVITAEMVAGAMMGPDDGAAPTGAAAGRERGWVGANGVGPGRYCSPRDRVSCNARDNES